MVEIRYQQAEIIMGARRHETALLFEGDLLLAIVVFLDPDYFANDPEIAGKWYVEVGFGPCAVGSRTVLFDTLDAGIAWASEKRDRSSIP